jgi:hypothetical protein
MPDDINTYRTVTPYLVVQDADAEMKFLKRAFGATETLCHRNADQTVKHAEMQVGNSLIMLGQSGEAWKALNAALYLWVPDVRWGVCESPDGRSGVAIRARGQALWTSQCGSCGSERNCVVDWLAGQVAGSDHERREKQLDEFHNR